MFVFLDDGLISRGSAFLFTKARLIVVFAMLAGACTGRSESQNQNQGLVATAHWGALPDGVTYDAKTRKGATVWMTVEFTNFGERPVEIPTQPLHVDVVQANDFRASGARHVGQFFRFQSTSAGKPIIPSRDTLGVVELRPGETTEIQFPVELGPRTVLSRVTFHFFVDQNFGTRMRLWSGHVECPVGRPVGIR